MRKTLSLIIIGLLCLSIFSMLALYLGQAGSSEPPATEWSQTYGGASHDAGYSVVKTSDGGYTIAGCTESFGAGGSDCWLVKTDWTGNMQWNKTYGGALNEGTQSMIQTSDGGYTIAGHTNSFGAGGRDFWLVKTDTYGNMEWNKTYGGTSDDMCTFQYCLVQTSDGGYAIGGWTKSFGAGSSDFWLIKTDAYGNMQWNQTYGDTGIEYAYSLVQTSDGGYAIAGWTNSFGAGAHDMWLVKTDADGNMEWNKTYGGTNWDEAYSVIQTSDGGYAIAGYTRSLGVGRWDFWLVKTDSTGIEEWNQTYGDVYDDYGHCVQQTGDGGYVIGGSTQVSSVGGSFDFWLIKTDAAGNAQWNQTFGGTGRDALQSMVQTGDGGYALAGMHGGPTDAEAGDYDFWLIKLAPEKILATVDIDPDTLNLKSNGQWITAYVTLPEDYSVEDIDVTTVKLMHNDDVVEAADWGEVQDGVLMVKFDRATLRDYLGVVDVDDGDKFCDITLTVTGDVAGILFEGCDTITVKSK
ncbi:hypothetical protein ES702_04155 [subsurface metagenome]